MDRSSSNQPEPTYNKAKNDGSKLLLFTWLPAASFGNYWRINEHQNILPSQSNEKKKRRKNCDCSTLSSIDISICLLGSSHEWF